MPLCSFALPYFPMSLISIGLNHNSAPLAIREAVSFAGEQLREGLSGLKTLDIEEGAILSTCNRTEVYAVAEPGATENLAQWLSRSGNIAASDLLPHLYQHNDNQTVRHSFRVAAGLDSMVLGEPQILGQMKQAIAEARATDSVGPLLSRMFENAFSVAKQVRTETEIGAHPVSIAFAGVKLAQRIFADMNSKTALLIGAGETIDLVARHLRQQGLQRLVFVNRSLDRAQILAQKYEGYAIPLDQLNAHLSEADILVSSTAASEVIVKTDDLKRSLAQRKRRPLFALDLAVPRDIEPTASRLDDMYLYTIDDLRGVIETNLKSRGEAAKNAESIIDERTARFMQWLESRQASSTIRHLRQQAQAQRDVLLENAIKQLEAGEDAADVLRAYGRSLTNKILHTPTATLRKATPEDQGELLKTTRRLFDLD